ncbi:MAG: exosortase [Sedimentisphaerales bacterium]|nr:exosortase [Sedimentisphaerales bacterium]
MKDTSADKETLPTTSEPIDCSVDPSESSVQMIDRIWKIVILGFFFVVFFRQELIKLFKSWGTPSESHGLLIPFFSLYFIYQERESLRQTAGKNCYSGLVIIFLSMLVYFYCLSAHISYPQPIMMIFMLGGIVLLVGGWPIFRIVWLPIFFLIFAIKLPASIHEGLTIPMRILASSVASSLLNLLPGIECESSNVLIHGTHLGEPFDLNVAEACSGMRLLRTFVALGVAMAYLEKRPLIHRIILLISTFPIAIFCNMIRVLLTGLIYIYMGPQYAQGTLHDVLGILMLILAFGLYGVLVWLMNNLFIEEGEEEEEEDDILVINQ